MTPHSEDAAAPSWEAMVTVGRIVRPHGHRGQMVVASETDFGAERFRVGARLFLLVDGRVGTATVTASRPHGGRWVIGLDVVQSMNDAEPMRGRELKVPEGERRSLAPGAYYEDELAGCRVETLGGLDVGVVRRVDASTGTPVLVVNGERGEVLVPLAEAICRQVDVAGRRIVIDPPDGLLELNAPQGRRGQPPREHG